jgi:hypothetical protein
MAQIEFLDDLDDVTIDVRDTHHKSSMIVPPEPLLRMIYDSMDVIDTIREKRIEESEKAYMLLHIAGMVPEVESNFGDSIEGLLRRGRLRNLPHSSKVRDLVKHIKIHAVNAYSAKLKTIEQLKSMTLATKKLGGTVALDYDDFRTVNMFHNEYVVMNIERKFTQDLQRMTDVLMSKV